MIKLCHVAFFFVEYLYFCIDYTARHQMCAVSGIFRSCALYDGLLFVVPDICGISHLVIV